MNLCEAQPYFCVMIYILRSVTELLEQEKTQTVAEPVLEDV